MSVEIGVLIGIVSFVLGYSGFVRTRDKDVKQEAAEKAVMSTQLSHIGNGINSIQVKMEVNDEKFTELGEKVVKIDASAKAAHRRLDKIDGGRGSK